MKTVIADLANITYDGLWIGTLADDETVYEGETVIAYDPDEDQDIIAEVQWFDNELGLVMLLPVPD